MNNYWYLGCVIVALLTSSCGPASLAPTQADPVPTAVEISITQAQPLPSETLPTAGLPTVQGNSPETAPPVPPLSLDGETLLNERCTRCHNLNRVTSKSASADEWKRIVENMIGKGATLSDEEKLVLIDYLSSEYPD
jgi:cytochrome c5